MGPLLSVLRVSFGSHAVCVVGTVSGLSGPLAPIVCPSLESSVAVKNSSCGPRCPLSWWRLISGTDAARFQFLPQASDSCSRFSSLVGAGWVSMRIPEVRGGVPRRAARARAGVRLSLCPPLSGLRTLVFLHSLGLLHVAPCLCRLAHSLLSLGLRLPVLVTDLSRADVLTLGLRPRPSWPPGRLLTL